MAFPPSNDKKREAPAKKPGGPPAPGGGGPPGGDPFGGGGGFNPFGPAALGAQAQPSNLDPFGGGGMPGLGGMGPKPGQGMDPMAAMMGGLGAGGGPSAGPPSGGNGMPVGGTMPPQDDDMGGGPDMGGSGLLQALHAQLSGGQGGDPYGVAPGQPDVGFQGMGQGDPQMGAEQLLQLLALGQMGVGGGPPPMGGMARAGGSGIDTGPFGGMGQMVGMGQGPLPF